jgi:hypothetical protein
LVKEASHQGRFLPALLFHNPLKHHQNRPAMKETYSKLHTLLLREIERSQHSPCYLQRIELSFQCSTRHILQLRDEIRLHPFRSHDEEIYFFREVKPLFTSESEFYNMLYHGHLFRPEDNLSDLENFWLRESMRLEKYIEEHRSFYMYYKQGRRDLDGFYFLHMPETEDEVHTSDYGFTCRGDVLGKLMALERYAEFAMAEVKKVG